MQVFVGIHESDRSNNQGGLPRHSQCRSPDDSNKNLSTEADTNLITDLKELMLDEFSHYHPDLKHIIRLVNLHCHCNH